MCLPTGRTIRWVPDIDNPFEWSCKREKKNGVWGAFSDVYLWSKWGKDGKETESVYAQTKILATPSYTWSDVDNYVPSGWTSEPQGVTSEYIYEWIMQRKKVNGSWSHWSAPAIFAKWSKDRTDGRTGQTDWMVGLYSAGIKYQHPARQHLRRLRHPDGLLTLQPEKA